MPFAVVVAFVCVWQPSAHLALADVNRVSRDQKPASMDQKCREIMNF